MSLLQGNVEQEIKFDPQFRDQTLALYADLVAQARGRSVAENWISESEARVLAWTPDASAEHVAVGLGILAIR